MEDKNINWVIEIAVLIALVLFVIMMEACPPIHMINGQKAHYKTSTRLQAELPQSALAGRLTGG